MWKLSAFVVASLLLVAVAVPIEQNREPANTKPIILEAVDIPTVTVPVIVELQPSAETKPAEPSAPLVLPLGPPVLALAAPTEEIKPAEEAQPVVDAKPSEPNPSDLADSPSTSTTAPLPPTVPTIVDVSPPRRQVHYDQRQDGKFNIRADLDNFVILVVPSNGLSLLDLLKRSNQKPHHHKRNHKVHKKYYSKTSTVKTNDKNVKESNRLDYLRPESTEAAARPIGGEFIEGRTPYHVDITSSEISGSAPTSVADLPLSNNPSVVDATVFLPAQIKGNEYARNLEIPTLAIYPRHRKSLTNDDQSINTNSVSLTPIQNDNNYQHAIVNGNINDNGNGNSNGYGNDDYVKTDPTDILTGSEFYSLNMASIDPLAIASDTKTPTTNDSPLELTLLGAQEQCGPDRRRDSYGVCQFVPQDYVRRK